jgi:hypothetical protein
MGAVATPEEPIDALRAQLRPFEEAEMGLVRAVVSSPAFLSDADEAALRYAFNLARTTRVRAPDGADVVVGPFLAPYRADLLAAVATLAEPRGFAPADAAHLVPHVRTHARAWRARLLSAFAGRLPASALDKEVCEKALVLVCGGGGGVAWSYLGAFALWARCCSSSGRAAPAGTRTTSPRRCAGSPSRRCSGSCTASPATACPPRCASTCARPSATS